MRRVSTMLYMCRLETAEGRRVRVRMEAARSRGVCLDYTYIWRRGNGEDFTLRVDRYES